MKPFAAKLASGTQLVGIGLSASDLSRLAAGEPVTLDLSSVGIGCWTKEADGSREFVQPRDTRIVLLRGDSKEDISNFLGINLP